MTTNPNLPPPKKPVNAYFHFQRDKTLEFRQANPEMQWIEITKLLGQAYRQLPITEKKKYADLAAADKERYEKENQEYMEYMENCKIHAKKRRKSLPTDDEDEDEEYREDPPKKMKGDKMNDINLRVRRNPMNQVCFVEIDELTGKETLVPYVCLLNEMISSMPESEVTPELQCQIEELMQEDKEDIENGKRREKEMYEDLGAADQERDKKEFEGSIEECKIHTTKITNSLPTDNDDKAKDTQKETSDKDNNVIFEDAAGSRPGPNPNKPHVRRNSLNQICFVQIDILTGKEILVPGVYLLKETLNGIPESELTPEIWQKIEAARKKDKENVENAKREVDEKVNL